MSWQTIQRLECLLTGGSTGIPGGRAGRPAGATAGAPDAMDRLATYFEDRNSSDDEETKNGYAKINGGAASGVGGMGMAASMSRESVGQTLDGYPVELSAMPRNLSESSGLSAESMIGRDRPRSDDPVGGVVFGVNHGVLVDGNGGEKGKRKSRLGGR